MLLMPPAHRSFPGLFRRFVTAWVGPLALATAFVASVPAALAETGGSLPPGDVTPTPPSTQVPQATATPPVQDAPAPAPEQQADSDEYADTDPSALTDFQGPLAPYGQWVQDPTYGTLWVPDSDQVGADFAPYQSAGQWGTTDTGDWMWQSDYAWGYIPFHYGRWVWSSGYWGWIPGRRYAPAWVTWRVGEGGYLGWAPLPPTWYWGRGRAVGLLTVPHAAYCFVPTHQAFSRGVSAYVVRDRGMVQSIAATTHAYRPATPTIGSRSGMSPSLSQAHIPSSASPRTHAAVDARAAAFSTRSSTAALQRASRSRAAATRGGWSGSEGRRSSPTNLGYAREGVYERPSRAQGQGLRTPQPVYSYAHGGSSFQVPGHGVAPGFRPPAPAAHPPVPSPGEPSHPSGHSGHFGGGHRR